MPSTSGTYTIYKVENSLNGKFYIGITSRSVSKRWREHVRHAKYKVNNGAFYRAIRKYGEKVFNIIVLEIDVEPNLAKEKEISLIAFLKPHYNSTLGGDGTYGHKITKEGRERMSRANLGNKYNLGRIWTEEQRAHMRVQKAGCPAPLETEKMRQTRLRNIAASAETRRKPVLCLRDGITYGSVTEAAKAYSVNKTTVSSICRGKSGGSNGLSFQFVEER